ncbi:MAG: tryptophan--tRNA ligase [Candidatus Omnitrophica bacterium]|nr:tryptophan--tRNA ligase [Candidatus Omnitrophota bacterium]
MSKIVFSAMRPTGKLHLGHWLGALHNWVNLQKDHQCIFAIADWHALMSEYENSRPLSEYIVDMAIDWMACGIDPDKSILYVQSDVPEHLELQMVLSCLTPLSWLERNPTYKEQLKEIPSRNLQTHAFLGYPVLQAADILLYKANAVPIGQDQLPHLELCREIARRFNFLYKKEFFPDCQPILTQTPRLLGIDNRKMSKSYGNAINLSDSASDITQKAAKMITDPQRIHRSDPGRPEHCNVYSYYQALAPDLTKEVYAWCTGATKGCTECKKILADRMIDYLAPMRDKRAQLEKDKDRIRDILREGAKKAKSIAQKTMAQVRQAVFGS